MTRNSVRWLLTWVLSILVVNSAAAGEQQRGSSKHEAQPPAPNSRSVAKTLSKDPDRLQLRFEVLELCLSTEEIDRINRSAKASDIAAMAPDVVKRGDARVKFSIGGPVALGKEVALRTTHDIPYIARKLDGPDSDRPVDKTGREKVGGVVELMAVGYGEAGCEGVSVRLDVRFEFLSSSLIELPEGVNVPITSTLSQKFTARMPFGEDTYFWSMASPETARDDTGNPLTYVYRVRFDPVTAN